MKEENGPGRDYKLSDEEDNTGIILLKVSRQRTYNNNSKYSICILVVYSYMIHFNADEISSSQNGFMYK